MMALMKWASVAWLIPAIRMSSVGHTNVFLYVTLESVSVDFRVISGRFDLFRSLLRSDDW